ncbi:Uncharacterised protein [uncultured Flavonifractor sp.]|nr:Uncharacterised protein [uncultured Flavonifractor sp.]
MRHIPAATLETAQFFAHPHSQKPARFPAGQNERFHPAKPSFYPPAVTAGITHYTLQAKPCAKGASPLETPCFVGKSVRPTRLRLHPIPPKHKQAAWASPSSVLIYAACLPIWALTVSPILTVLIYYFHMYRRFADAELPGGAAHRGSVLYNVKRQLTGALLDVPLQTATLPACF